MWTIEMMSENEFRACFDQLDVEGVMAWIPLAVTPEVLRSIDNRERNWWMILDDEWNRVVNPKVVERMVTTRDLWDQIIRDMKG